MKEIKEEEAPKPSDSDPTDENRCLVRCKMYSRSLYVSRYIVFYDVFTHSVCLSV